MYQPTIRLIRSTRSWLAALAMLSLAACGGADNGGMAEPAAEAPAAQPSAPVDDSVRYIADRVIIGDGQIFDQDGVLRFIGSDPGNEIGVDRAFFGLSLGDGVAVHVQTVLRIAQDRPHLRNQVGDEVLVPGVVIVHGEEDPVGGIGRQLDPGNHPDPAHLVHEGMILEPLPVSASLISERIWEVLRSQSAPLGPFGHGHTTTAHPVGAAVALAVIAVNHLGGMEAMRAEVVAAFPQGDDAFRFLPDFSAADPWMPLSIFFIMLFVQWWASWYPGAEPGGGGYVVQRMASAKDERHSVLATLWFQIAHYCVRPWPWLIVAFAALAMYPELRTSATPDAGFPMVMRDLAPVGLRGLLLVAWKMTVGYILYLEQERSLELFEYFGGKLGRGGLRLIPVILVAVLCAGIAHSQSPILGALFGEGFFLS